LTSFRFHLIPLRYFFHDIIYQYFISFRYLISSSGTNKSIMSKNTFSFYILVWVIIPLSSFSYSRIFIFGTNWSTMLHARLRLICILDYSTRTSISFGALAADIWFIYLCKWVIPWGSRRDNNISFQIIYLNFRFTFSAAYYLPLILGKLIHQLIISLLGCK
jgi:hypothetical protein